MFLFSCPGWKKGMAVFIFKDLGSLRLVLRADRTKPLHGRVVPPRGEQRL